MSSQFFCIHYLCPTIHFRPNDYPRYTIYSTLKACQDACINAVPKCNSVNYAPATVSNKRSCLLVKRMVCC